VPIDLLRDIHIVDTPGTNAVVREHEVLTTHFVPRADVVLFVTSVDRPFSESERLFLDSIAPYLRFVRAEGETLTAAKTELERYGGELEVLQARVEAMA
jgi:hypothetical protein